EARRTSSEVVKSAHLDRTFAIASLLNLLLRGREAVPPGQLPDVSDLLRRARVGRAGAVILIGRDDRLVWDEVDEQLGRAARAVYPGIEPLLAEARFGRERTGAGSDLARGSIVRDNALAETGLIGEEFWVLTPVAGGRYTLASHAPLDGRDAAALAKAQATLDG